MNGVVPDRCPWCDCSFPWTIDYMSAKRHMDTCSVRQIDAQTEVEVKREEGTLP